MRVCPECRRQYADDVEVCPDDGNELLEADDLPANPSLRDVVPVSPTDHTAMIDLEAIEAERERRGLNRPKEPEPSETDAAAEEEEEEARRDPDATGTFHIDDLKKRDRTRESSAMGSAVDGDEDLEESDDDEGSRTARVERTEITRRPRFDDPTMGRAAPRGQRMHGAPGERDPKVLVAAIAGVVVLALGLAAGVWWYVSSRGAVLTVTSVPPGATVVIDGKELGKAPVQERVSIGSHVIELSLEGFRPFKEVVDVPAEGLPFLQPLEPDPGAKPKAPKADAGAGEPTGDESAEVDGTDAPDDEGPEGAEDARRGAPPTADELVAKFEELLSAASYDAALETIKELVKHHPNDGRVDGLFERLADARIQAATGTTGAKGTKGPPKAPTKRTLTPEQRKREAREAYATGEALYREGSYAEARAKLREAIELDPRFAQPHRAIARIYEREGNIPRTRYHLDRYLRLGGKDPDYRVRRWLDDNKD